MIPSRRRHRALTLAKYREACSGIRSARTFCGLFLPALAIAACEDVSSGLKPFRERVSAAAGCYNVSSPRGVALMSFRLIAESVSAQRPRLFRVEHIPPDTVNFVRLWDVDSLSDTVRVSVGDLFSGTFFRGVPVGAGLDGQFGRFSDVAPLTYGLQRARADRIPCI